MIGGISTDRLKASQQVPMLRVFNDHDYVFQGAGFIEHAVQNSRLIPIRAAYSRNMDRVFVLFDFFEESAKPNGTATRIPAILGSILIQAKTSYEVLIDDLFELLNSESPSNNLSQKNILNSKQEKIVFSR